MKPGLLLVVALLEGGWPADGNARAHRNGAAPPSSAQSGKGTFLARVKRGASRAEVEALGKTAMIGPYKGEVLAVFSRDGNLEVIGFGAHGREARCSAAIRDVVKTLQQDFGAPTGRWELGDLWGTGETRVCRVWSLADSRLRACCTQRVHPGGGLSLMSISATRTFRVTLHSPDEPIP